MIKSLSQTQFEKLDKAEQRKYIKEWTCICNECKEKWHYLDTVEKQMNSQIGLNGLLQAGNCCNPCVGTATSNANTQLKKQVGELKQCPKCKSSNVKKDARYHEEE